MFYHKEYIRPRYEETDQMGVIYHGNYITWFEQARSGFFRELGYSYKRLEDEGYWIPVIEVGCKYFAPAKYDEEVYVKTSIAAHSGVRIELKYQVYDVETDTLLVEGFTKHATTDKNLRPISLKKKAPELYKLVITCFENE
ncbi:acyl-CoA thioesterase [Acidaminobacter sp. JC074]|uniref:acyl-CoA thioesterase n=1 Tax=Acidaminobacter sp. JC074 TaxID=2530199 RepID=UPI001F0DAEEE|nr:thioesterase family protein [Acidaminobacter sp. JC074]MCH4888955.1 acyl-CoA thioesterase [Acidaminobacter sp. JC074]